MIVTFDIADGGIRVLHRTTVASMRSTTVVRQLLNDGYEFALKTWTRKR